MICPADPDLSANGGPRLVMATAHPQDSIGPMSSQRSIENTQLQSFQQSVDEVLSCSTLPASSALLKSESTDDLTVDLNIRSFSFHVPCYDQNMDTNNLNSMSSLMSHSGNMTSSLRLPNDRRSPYGM